MEIREYYTQIKKYERDLCAMIIILDVNLVLVSYFCLDPPVRPPHRFCFLFSYGLDRYLTNDMQLNIALSHPPC